MMCYYLNVHFQGQRVNGMVKTRTTRWRVTGTEMHTNICRKAWRHNLECLDVDRRTLIKKQFKKFCWSLWIFCLYQNMNKYRSLVNRITNKDPVLMWYYVVQTDKYPMTFQERQNALPKRRLTTSRFSPTTQNIWIFINTAVPNFKNGMMINFRHP